MNPVVAGPEPLSAAERSLLGEAGAACFLELLGSVQDGLHTLADKPEETPEATLRALWLRAAGRPASAQLACDTPLESLTDPQRTLLQDLLQRRLHGTPLAHLTGRQRFMGVEMLAGPQALIPRRETELLGMAVAVLLEDLARTRHEPMVLDVCTGSGNLAVGIACAIPTARVFASDLSHEAVGLAQQNVRFLGLDSRVEVRQGDLLEPFDTPEFLESIDVLICNPPYISSGKVGAMPLEISEHEPALAFDGGPFGIRIIQRLLQDAPRMLRTGGWLAFEVGLGQGPAVMRRMTSSKCYDDIRALNDEQGDIRALMGRLAPGVNR